MSEETLTQVTFRHVVPGSVVQEQTSESEVISHQFLGGILTFYKEEHPKLFVDLDKLAKTQGTGVSYYSPEKQEDNQAPEQKQAAEQVKMAAATAASRLSQAANRG